MELSKEIIEKIEKLREKFASSGQDLNSYLEGLLYSDYLKYWDYINLDVLLNLQHPKTHFPDEQIFIMYHQITELYFKLSLHAIHQITDARKITKEEFVTQINRVISYFKILSDSFEIMVSGMDKEQFLKFRMSLLPASGFQSAQYRVIEICCTDAYNLVAMNARGRISADSSFEEMYENFYWKLGGIELATGKKTLTLQQFEEKYTKDFLRIIDEYKNKNVWQKYKSLTEEDRKDEEVINTMKALDVAIEVLWPLKHYRSAVRHLHLDPEDIKATGGTTWQKYLPPRFQYIHLFPELLSPEEMENWGKQVDQQRPEAKQ